MTLVKFMLLLIGNAILSFCVFCVYYGFHTLDKDREQFIAGGFFGMILVTVLEIIFFCFGVLM